MSKNILLTGATGNIGIELALKILSENNTDRLILLCRGDNTAEIKERFQALVTIIAPEFELKSCINRITFLNGDIIKPYLNISNYKYHKLVSEITHIIHAAASTKFNLDTKSAQQVNFYGTRNILKLARHACRYSSFRKFAYISTAFVCGNRDGIIYEDAVYQNIKFTNSYEYSKWQAEDYLRTFFDDIDICIFRPGIVVGHSKTGKILKFNVMYSPLKYILRGLIRVLPADKENPLDIVPVDFVAESIYHILFKNTYHKKQIYHITSGLRNTPTICEIIDHAMKINNSYPHSKKLKPLLYAPVLNKFVNTESTASLEKVTKYLGGYLPYILNSKLFDTTNLDNALRNSPVHKPHYRDYLDTVLRYFISTQISNPAGKHSQELHYENNVNYKSQVR